MEDNSGDVILIRRALKEHGVNLEVMVISDGERALHFIQQVDEGSGACPALVVLDLNLPRTNGRDVLKRMRESPACGTISIVVLSSSDATQDRQESLRLGANQYVRKPSNLDDFLKVGGILKKLLPAAEN